jgi:hypothetical protein
MSIPDRGTDAIRYKFAGRFDSRFWPQLIGTQVDIASIPPDNQHDDEHDRRHHDLVFM